jgi:hypothetical protein
MEEKKQNKQINIEINDEMAEGTYSNLAVITHSNAEFIVDFLKMMPGIAKAKVKSRIILTPQHAKRLLKALQDNITKYEHLHGEIKVPEKDSLPLNFGGPPAQA